MAWKQSSEPPPRPPLRGTSERLPLVTRLRVLQSRLRGVFRPTNGRAWLLIALVAVFLWLISGYYQLADSERGVVLRFGRYVATELPGQGWRWPWPVESLTKVNVMNQGTLQSRQQLLTADGMLADVTWIVHYRVGNAADFLSQVREPDLTLRLASESVIRELVAHTNLNPLLRSDGRTATGVSALPRIQQLLNGYRSGLDVVSVEVDEVRFPDVLLPVQRVLEQAAQERAHAIDEANGYSVALQTKTDQEVARQRADAQAYAERTVAGAEGDVAGFNARVDAYEKSPALMREQLYAQMMQDILARSRKIIIDGKSGKDNMLYLPVDKLIEAVRAAPATAPVTAPGSEAAAASPSAPGAAAAPAAPTANPDPAAANRGGRLDEDTRSRSREQR